MNIQFDLFLPIDDESLVKQELEQVKLQYDKLRKSFFARQAGQDKEIMRLSNELEALRSMLLERKK